MKWQTFSSEGSLIIQQTFVKGVRVERYKKYGTLANPHAPSRWRTSGYGARGKSFDHFTDALNYALRKTA